MRIPVLALLSSVLLFFSAKSQTWQLLGPDDFNQPSFLDVDATKIALDAGGHPYLAYRDFNNNGKLYVKKFNGSSWELVGGAAVSTGSAGNLSFIMAGYTPYIAYTDNGHTCGYE